MPGLQLGELLSSKPEPVQRGHVDWYNELGGIGDALGRSIQQSRQNDFEQQRIDREKSRDTRNDERERGAEANRARETLRADKRADLREGLYAKQEERRQASAEREHSDKDRAEHEQLLHDWQMALQIPDPQARASAVHFAADALHRAGFQVEEYGQQFGSPPAAAPQGSAPGGIEDVGELQNGQTPGTAHAQPQRPMLPGEASSVGRQLDQADARYMGALTDKQRPSANDARLSGQLDAIDNKYMSALAPARAPLPGQSPFAVTRSNQLLSQDDPYNSIR